MEEREFFIGGGFLGPAAGESHYTSENRYVLEQKPVENGLNANNFTVDELLDFSKHDEDTADDFFDSATGRSSTVTAVDGCNSSVSGGQFSGNFSCCSFTDAPFTTSELCVPYDDLAELEWLSNFVEDSFSSDEVQNLQLILAAKNSTTAAINAADSSSSANANGYSLPAFPSDVSVPGKARSKRSRAAPCDWSSRLLLLSPAKSQTDSNNASATTAPKMSSSKTTSSRRRESTDTQGRKCLHCASEKTPQWRTGPMGPKTLCNACGVRYKSGRLVPEYRPAASPTFVSTKHSNSHRKVTELRRQKDLQRQHHVHHQQQLLSQASMFGGVSNGGDGYLLHHHQSFGPDYAHMI